MQGLAPDRVAYAGTASKTLAPGLRLGWLILPARLVEPMSHAKLMDDRGSPVFDQLAFADFVARGEFDRHLRRMRPRYRLLRDTLVAAAGGAVAGVRAGRGVGRVARDGVPTAGSGRGTTRGGRARTRARGVWADAVLGVGAGAGRARLRVRLAHPEGSCRGHRSAGGRDRRPPARMNKYPLGCNLIRRVLLLVRVITAARIDSLMNQGWPAAATAPNSTAGWSDATRRHHASELGAPRRGAVRPRPSLGLRGEPVSGARHHAVLPDQPGGPAGRPRRAPRGPWLPGPDADAGAVRRDRRRPRQAPRSRRSR